MFNQLKEEWKRTPITIMIGILCLFSVIGMIGLSWRRLGTPEEINTTNKSYTNNSQWQAMIMVPGKDLPFTVEQFLYRAPEGDDFVQRTNKKINELRGRCIFWTEAKTEKSDYTIINCVKERIDEAAYKKSEP